jgi:transposase
MVTDQQVRRLRMLLSQGKSQVVAAVKSGMDVKTARKYSRTDALPSELKKPREWRTRRDPFEEVWPELEKLLEDGPGLEAKTLFDYLQRKYPGRYQDGQLRTLQRGVKSWRATSGPSKEVYFDQVHTPGALAESDFVRMGKMNITIARRHFDHLLYHFVLTFSNWEAVSICFSESFESLSEGMQSALWKLGGAPKEHQTDQLTPAVKQNCCAETFTSRYKSLLRHYGITGRKTNVSCPHENGDVEQRHHRTVRAIEQALLLRGSRDFVDRAAYEAFLQDVVKRLNAGRQKRFSEEVKTLKKLPLKRLETSRRVKARVRVSSTIRVLHNVYSIHSRMIGEMVDVWVHAEHLDVWYGSRRVERLPRLQGRGKHHINYRHIIDWLERKPGALSGYCYREELFPTSNFRLAHDMLHEQHTQGVANREYIKILALAARENEARVDDALATLLGAEPLTALAVKTMVASSTGLTPVENVIVNAVELSQYDVLLDREAAS